MINNDSAEHIEYLQVFEGLHMHFTNYLPTPRFHTLTTNSIR